MSPPKSGKRHVSRLYRLCRETGHITVLDALWISHGFVGVPHESIPGRERLHARDQMAGLYSEDIVELLREQARWADIQLQDAQAKVERYRSLKGRALRAYRGTYDDSSGLLKAIQATRAGDVILAGDNPPRVLSGGQVNE